jgi:hypothetical protein
MGIDLRGAGYGSPLFPFPGATIMELAEQMNGLMAFVETCLTAGTGHWDVCRMTADRFSLWQSDHFPLWLSFVVAGQMREMGMEG